MLHYGLIGYPLGHSFSAGYFNKKFSQEQLKAQYHLWPIKNIEEIQPLLNDVRGLAGFNVTIPHKSAVIGHLQYISKEALDIGAVNCIKIQNGQLWGTNTDWWGFYQSLKPLLKAHHQRALILGNGGSAKAVGFALGQLGIDYQVVSRQGPLNYTLLNDDYFSRYTLIINCTPLGMYPNIEDCPNIPYSLLGKNHLLYDLVYNPEQTRFLQKGISQNTEIKNGLEMLYLQADKAWAFWDNPIEEQEFIRLR